MEALSQSQAVIEFEPDGTIITANKNFLDLMGYTLDEIRGAHHRLFVDEAEQASREYREFWERLRRGEFQVAQYRRLAKGGKEVWIEASYNPIAHRGGKPFKVVKYATDVTKQKQQFADLIGQIKAIHRSQAVIEFDLNGTILHANENFLATMGYTLDEIQGKHHSMFVLASDRDSPAYREFWAKLGRGEYQTAQYQRVGKGGKEVWIEASYNPIFDLSGKPFKIVKYATDLTKRKLEKLRIAQEFEQGVKSLVDTVSSSAGNMRDMAQTIAAAAESTLQKSATTAVKMGELSDSASIIAEQSDDASSMVEQAVADAKNASAQVSQIVGVARKIGDVARTIDDIAAQTHLLSLNATIEAARAGDYGMGFAVVAGEVKALAQQTASATKEIAQLAEGMRTSSGAIVEAIKLISEVITRVNDLSLSISGAMKEQSSATHVAEVDIQDVKTAAENSGHLSTGILEVSRALSTNASELQVRVDGFLHDVRAM